MLKHNFKVSFRNILKNKGYAYLNILGLTFGIAASTIIYLWTLSELAVDHQHVDSERIFNVYSKAIYGAGIEANRNTPAKLPEELKKAIPEIELATGFTTSFRLSLLGVTEETFQIDDNIVKMSGSRGSPDFFNIFSYRLLAGSADNALKELHNIAISRKMAEVFFGSPEEAFGKSIRYQNSKNLTVTAVYENVGDNSSLKFDYLTSWQAWVDSDPIKQSWNHFGTQTYIKLAKGADTQATEAKIKDFLSTYVTQRENYQVELGLQPFEEQYLYGNFENGVPSASRITYVKAFQWVSFFILVIAVINFINLSSATATKKGREVAIRKVVGASRFLLRGQFMTEAMLLTSISALLALLLVLVLLPSFNIISVKNLSFPWDSFSFWGSMLMLVIFVGFVSGAYPAFILSQIEVIPALKRLNPNGAKASLIRQGLVVFQFVLAIFLVVITLAVGMQTSFIRDKNLGFEKNQLIYIPLEGELINNYSLFRIEASRMPGIISVDRSSQPPHDMGFSGSFVNWEGKGPDDQIVFTPSSVGFDFAPTMGLVMRKGRSFDRDRPADAMNFLINEAAEKSIGMDDVLGKTLKAFGREGKVIGVFKDFHYSSLHTPIKPMILDIKENLNFGTAIVRFEEGQEEQAIESLKTVCEMVNPGYAFSYNFVSNAYDNLYRVETTMSSLTSYFSLLAIFISCLGLFGLVTFATALRRKEIGIRKILGASVAGLFHLLSKQFISLLLIAIVLAVPLSYLVIANWLDGFAYRITIEWWLFAIACLATLTISYLVIGIRITRAALSDPVNVLRND